MQYPFDSSYLKPSKHSHTNDPKVLRHRPNE